MRRQQGKGSGVRPLRLAKNVTISNQADDGPAGEQRGRAYAYSGYLALLDRGIDPLPA